MLHHNTEGGLFSGYEDAGHRSEEEDTADLYSVLSTLEDFRGDDGKLHFKLCYPEVRWAETADRCNEWRQQSNPYTSTEIRGFEAVGKLAFPHQSECRPWKVGTETLLQCRYPLLLYYYLQGIGLDIAGELAESVINDSPNVGAPQRHSAIGALRYWQHQPYIAGPRRCHEQDWRVDEVTKVYLYVKKDD